MPLKKDDPTYKEIDERLKTLEEGKISVKNLPINDLRRVLNKAPQDPGQLILPHSIGPDLLKSGVQSSVTTLAMTGTFKPLTEATFTVIPGMSYETPSFGSYLITCSFDTEVTEVTFGVLQLTVGGFQVGSALNSTGLQRMPLAMTWGGIMGKGTIIAVGAARTGAGTPFSIYGGNLVVTRLA